MLETQGRDCGCAFRNLLEGPALSHEQDPRSLDITVTCQYLEDFRHVFRALDHELELVIKKPLQEPDGRCLVEAQPAMPIAMPVRRVRVGGLWRQREEIACRRTPP